MLRDTEMKTKYPTLVTKLTTLCDGWLVGSSAIKDNPSPRDYDIFIPINKWFEASNLIPTDAKINSMGGFKVVSDGVEIDIWTGLMETFLTSNYFKTAYNPKTGIRIIRDEN